MIFLWIKKSSRAHAPKRAPPALIAFHLVPAPKDKEPVYVPIGSAIAHPDGEGYTLRLDLTQSAGNGQIVLRKPKVKDEADTNVAADKASN